MFATLQKIGRSLMLPIAVLPAAGILLRFGQPDLLNIPWLADAGGAIFGNLPLLFAIGVAIGFSEGAGVAGLAGAVGYWVMTKVATDINPTINMGVLAGIIMGLLGAFLYNRYHTQVLPEFLAFFGGRRFVPIITAFAAVVLGLVFGVIWPPIQNVIAVIGRWSNGQPIAGGFVFGLQNRLLIPFGLHHVGNSLIWFQLPGPTPFYDASGKEIFGDLNRFFAGDRSAGLFMTGWFPIMMFALPAACLAMWKTAKGEGRKVAAGVLWSAALTSFVTGITEPVEFSFMFVAPVLYVLHATLSGLSLAICNLLNIHCGFTFSAGVIDYLLNWGISVNPILVIPVGLVFGVVYYFLFVNIIERMDLPTPGREKVEAGEV
ncbi:MAG: PTS transporter subunit EIIC [Chloroflexi bacterium]|nr:PTS transporter subunit EIIC [Chloroflexota bacterium]